jgi:hypothetical protein
LCRSCDFTRSIHMHLWFSFLVYRRSCALLCGLSQDCKHGAFLGVGNLAIACPFGRSVLLQHKTSFDLPVCFGAWRFDVCLCAILAFATWQPLGGLDRQVSPLFFLIEMSLTKEILCSFEICDVLVYVSFEICDFSLCKCLWNGIHLACGFASACSHMLPTTFALWNYVSLLVGLNFLWFQKRCPFFRNFHCKNWGILNIYKIFLLVIVMWQMVSLNYPEMVVACWVVL